MMLLDLGIAETRPSREAVAIVVGPNGSGKSTYLRELANHYRFNRKVMVVCNTPHDRFLGIRHIHRISVGRPSHSPKSVIKNAVATTIDAPDSRFYQIAAILKYCGYRSKFGFTIDEPSRRRKFYDLSDSVKATLANDLDFQAAMSFLERRGAYGPIWIDPTEPVLSFSQAREFASVLRHETVLRTEHVIRGVRVYLEREDGKVIELHRASSGQLSLISSLLFLIMTAKEDPIIIVDEPENSLHPSWQREYVNKVLAAMSYRNATVIVATHSPLIVTGAMSENPNLVSVFQIHGGRPVEVRVDEHKGSPSGIEEILWRAFEVVTPANHFVSEQIVGEISRFENGEIDKATVLSLIGEMEQGSFDERQTGFFRAVRQLLDKVEISITTGGS